VPEASTLQEQIQAIQKQKIAEQKARLEQETQTIMRSSLEQGDNYVVAKVRTQFWQLLLLRSPVWR
jgi:hypothetical protein